MTKQLTDEEVIEKFDKHFYPPDVRMGINDIQGLLEEPVHHRFLKQILKSRPTPVGDVEEIVEDMIEKSWFVNREGKRLYALSREQIKYVLASHTTKEVEDAYTRGRSDEAKTCTGCQGRCDKRVEDAVKAERKAFGGCTKCYGKGYSTVIDSTTYHADFLVDKTYTISNNPMRFCSCDRGKQLQALTQPNK